MPLAKIPTKKLQTAGFVNLEVHRGLWGFSVQDKRYKRQSWEAVRKTSKEVVEDVLIHGKLPKEIK